MTSSRAAAPAASTLLIVVGAAYSLGVLLGEVAAAVGTDAVADGAAAAVGVGSATADCAAADNSAAADVGLLRLSHLLLLGLLRWLFLNPACRCYLAATS